MSDNIKVNRGNDVDVATDDVGGVQYQRVKVSVGAEGAAADAAVGAGASSSNVLRVVTATDSPVALGASTNAIGYVGGTEYAIVAPSSTATIGGAAGDYLNFLLMTPLTVSPGYVVLIDSGPVTTATTVFAGGTSSVTNLIPFSAPIMAKSLGAWQVMTSTNVRVLAAGSFT